MTTLSKDEVIAMARKAGFIIGRSVTTGQPESPERLITLARADLEAELNEKRESIALALQEVDSLKADAERYRWLKDNRAYHYSMQPDSPAEHGIEYQWQQGSYEERDHGIDQSIDNAMKRGEA